LGKLVRVAEGRKHHKIEGKTHFPHELSTNMAAGRSSSTAQKSGVGKLVKVAVGGKLHRRGRKTHFPHEL
jgi:hypothetical protein